MVPTVAGVPVLLPAHVHPEFGDPDEHYHIDWRYHPGPPIENEVVFSKEEVVYKDLPQLREVYQLQITAIRVSWYLMGKYKTKTVTDCGKCPHKGLPVYNGVCSGHGMIFNKDGTIDQETYCTVGGKLARRIGHLLIAEMTDFGRTAEFLWHRSGGDIIQSFSLGQQVSYQPSDILKISLANTEN